MQPSLPLSPRQREDDPTLSQKCLDRQEVPMSRQQTARWSRRQFLGGLTLAGTAGFLGLHPGPVAAEPPPETTRLRLGKTPGICIAPQYVADDLLHTEGFADGQYVAVDPAKLTTGIFQQLASGATDINITFVPPS